MRELVFLLEEESAEALLETLLPRFLSPEISPRFISFDGKQDLEKQLAKRLRGYMNPVARFIVLRDQDSAPDCKTVKGRLLQECVLAGKQTVSLVRIACRELEAFYVADLEAVGLALGLNGIAAHQAKARFRLPDSLGSPSRELQRLTENMYQKVSGSRQIGYHLNIENTRCRSFHNLIRGIKRMEQQLLAHVP